LPLHHPSFDVLKIILDFLKVTNQFGIQLTDVVVARLYLRVIVNPYVTVALNAPYFGVDFFFLSP